MLQPFSNLFLSNSVWSTNRIAMNNVMSDASSKSGRYNRFMPSDYEISFHFQLEIFSVLLVAYLCTSFFCELFCFPERRELFSIHLNDHWSTARSAKWELRHTREGRVEPSAEMPADQGSSPNFACPSFIEFLRLSIILFCLSRSSEKSQRWHSLPQWWHSSRLQAGH